MSREETKNVVPALKVRQWLSDWDEVKWSEKDRGTEPQHWFYQFSMPAKDLKALSGIYPRTTKRKKGAEDLGIQRRHENARSNEIFKFVKYGYPWSELSEAKRKSGEFQELRQPGWLPTAIVVNILTANDTRVGKQVSDGELIDVVDQKSGTAEIKLPSKFTGGSWKHSSVPPIEIIDGQHRLWAFEDTELDGEFELPVVAFVGLDLRWQAYLFYKINIKPKKINASLAFDLYPLLRTQEWLTKFEGHVIYRETRAQELVDLLWSNQDSPWHHRINMLGEKGYKGRMVTQAAWVRSLLASFIKSWEGPGVKIGGLFGTVVGVHKTVLPWSRTEQAAFLIVAGQKVRDLIRKADEPWMEALRKQAGSDQTEGDDSAFCGKNSLLNQDQGIRTLLQVLNDLLYLQADDLALGEWGGQQEVGQDDELISNGIKSLKKNNKIMKYIEQIANSLAKYDWRSSDGPDMTDEDRLLKASFRGSGGYKELRRDVLKHLAEGSGDVSKTAGETMRLLRY